MQLGSLVGVLQDMGVPRSQLGLLKTLLQHAGCEKRAGDLYSNRSFTSRFATMAKQNLRVRTLNTDPLLFLQHFLVAIEKNLPRVLYKFCLK